MKPSEIDMRGDPDFIHFTIASVKMELNGFTEIEYDGNHLSCRYEYGYLRMNVFKFGLVDSLAYRRIIERNKRKQA